MSDHFSELSDQSLVHQMMRHERSLVDARFKHSMNQLENTASLRFIGRDIARIRTELRAREIKAGLRKDALVIEHEASYAPATASTEAEEGGEAASGGFLKGIVDKLSKGD